MIRIVNMKNYRSIDGETLVRIDRKTVLGNPFYMNNESERNLVCDQYEVWLQEQIKSNREVCDALNYIWKLARDGKNVALGCWCAPKRCHGESIKRVVESRL